jgi:hypothetical protein
MYVDGLDPSAAHHHFPSPRLRIGGVAQQAAADERHPAGAAQKVTAIYHSFVPPTL